MKLLIGNFRGPEGKQGEPGRDGERGDTGPTGPRGSRWHSGIWITGTSTAGAKFPGSGITEAQVHDCYINTDTGNLYECAVPGAADAAEWVHIGNFKGPAGPAGPAGSISDINSQRPAYEESEELENIESGETVKAAFGKLKKAVSVLISHYMNKATLSMLGHVKLSDSAAVTTAGEYALDAVEKNASVNGTLANAIDQLNSDLAYAYAARWGTPVPNKNVIIGNHAVQWNTAFEVCFVYIYAEIKLDSANIEYVLATNLPVKKFGFTPIGVAVDEYGKGFTIGINDQNNLVILSGRSSSYTGAIRGFVCYAHSGTPQ